MKLRKIMAAVMACSIVCGAPAAIRAYQPSYELTANAEDFSSVVEGGIKYWVYDDHAEVARNIDIAGDVNIASAVNGVPVTIIGEQAFEDCKELTSITIPDGVTSIDDRAFCECSELASITIPDSLTSIGDDAFVCCSKLTSITIPDGVTSIGRDAFDECSGLTSINIPDSVTSIGYGAFYRCSGLTSIIIPDGVTSIGDWTFSECSALTSVTIPSSVTSISDKAFNVDSNVTIYGYRDSYAETYAKENDMLFVAVDKAAEAPATTSANISTTTTTTTSTVTTTTTATETETTSAETTTATAGSPSVNDERIVGQWYVYMISWKTEKGATDLLPNDDQYIVNFKNDGTFTLNTKKDTGYSEDQGTWSVSGDNLTIIRPDGVSDSAVISDSWTFKGQKWIVVQDNKELYLVRGGKFSAPVTTTATQPVTTTTTETTTTESTTTETTTAATTAAATPSDDDTRVVGTWYLYKYGNEDKMTTVAVADTATQLILNSDFTYKEIMHLTLGGGQISESSGTWSIKGDAVTLNTESDGKKQAYTHTYIDGELVHETNGIKYYYTKDMSKFPYATEKDKLIGTWTEKEAKISNVNGPMDYCFRSDGTGFYTWKENNPNNYIVQFTWSTDGNVLTIHEDVEDGSDITYGFGFSEDTLCLTGNKGMESELNRQETVSFGDPTGDGKIDAKDSSFVLVEYAKLSTGGESTLSDAEKSAADVNKDGKADAKDASAILTYYAYVSTGGDKSISEFLTNE